MVTTKPIPTNGNRQGQIIDYSKGRANRDRDGYIVPHERDAEECTIGSLLMDPTAIERVAPLVDPEDFHLDTYRWIYEAALTLHRRGVGVDNVTIEAELKSRDRLGDIGGFIPPTLIARVPTSAHAEHYAKLVKQASINRQVIAASSELARIGHENSGTEDLAAKLRPLLEHIATIAPVKVADEDADDEAVESPLLQSAPALGNLGWLDDYVGIMCDLTNAPASFNLLCGIATVAAASQGRAVLPMAFGDVRPNIYAALVAPSTVYHKTTSINRSKDVLVRASLNHLLFAPQFSSEGLLTQLSERPAGIIHRDEIGTLFMSDRVKYLQTVKQDLTALYDGDDYSRQLSNKTVTVTRPYLNILGATTPTRFYEGVSLADWQDGFLARWLFALPDAEPDFEASAVLLDEGHKAKLDMLAARLKGIDGQPPTAFIFEGDAFKRWNEWQRHCKKSAYLYGDDVISSITGRYSTYALKFAMLLASVNGKFGRISPTEMEQGIALADHFKFAVQSLLEGRQNHGISGDKMQRVFSVIRDKGPQVRTKTIQQFAHLNASEVRAVIDRLAEIGAIVSEKAGKGYAYTATTDKLPVRSW